MIPLTPKQEELLRYLRSCERCPTFDEMKDALGLKSKSGVHRLVVGLESKGFIRRLRDRARAIELVEKPQLPPSLSVYPVRDLVHEARRRGLVLGEYHRDIIRVGDVFKERRSFVELNA